MGACPFCQNAVQYQLRPPERGKKTAPAEFPRGGKAGTNMTQQEIYRLQIPEGYRPVLDLLETEKAIKELKDFFQKELAAALRLTRVSAPLFVRPETGLNDNLNGVERPVAFDVPSSGREPGGDRPFPGEVEALRPGPIPYAGGNRLVHRYERHPPG